MSNSRFLLAVLLVVVLPTLLYGRWIKDVVVLETEAVGKVEFSHYTHMEMDSIGKNCPTCHNDVYHIVQKKNPAFTMSEMESGKACGSCHNGNKAFDVTGDCTTCHASDVEMNYGLSEKVMFSHDIHAGMFGCDECHPDLFIAQRNSNQVGMAKMEEGESCGACHDGSTAFGVSSDCSSCHESASDIAMESDVGDVMFSHTVHMDMFGCEECHPDIFQPKANSNKVGMASMEEGASCGACHDGGTAFGVSSDCITCHSNAKNLAINAENLGPVPFSHSLHTDMFTCSECHPDIFKAKANSNQVGMASMEEGASCGACHDGSSAFGVTETCNTCHTGELSFDVAVPMQSSVGAIVFSHGLHTDMFTCDECHSDIFKARANTNQVGMAKMEEGASCGACHDNSMAFGVSGDCTTCHDKAVNLAITTQDVGTVPFSHEVHMDMFGCDECHPDLFKAQVNSNQVGMAQMEEGASCGACHDGSTAFGVGSDCAVCHTAAADTELQAKNVEPVPFSHEVHMDMFGCDECHPDVFKAEANSNQVGMAAMEEGASCGACHDGGTAFSVEEACTSCHTQGISYTRDIAMKSTIWTIQFSHKIHTDMFSCDECHPDIFKAKANSNQVGMAAMEEGASCGACHDGNMAFNVSGDCITCHDNSSDIAMQAQEVGTVPFSHGIHTDMFGCDECHPDLFKAEANSNQVGMAKMEEGASCGACHDGGTAFGVSGDCATCHSGAVEVEMVSKDVGTVPFSHEIHTDMFGCDECHSDIFKPKANSNQVGMAKMEEGASCGACHDGDMAFGVSGDCTTCHTNAADEAILADYVGTVLFSHDVHTDMFGCSECHPDLFTARANSNQVGMAKMEEGASCGACHDGDSAFGVKDDCTTCHAGDVVFDDFGKTVFSHALHNDLFSCEACHPKVFKAQRGANKATMEDMENGQSCGACHNGGRAFPVSDCRPCHLN